MDEIKTNFACDIYISQEISGNSIKKFISVVVPSSEIDADQVYYGYLGLNIKRLKGLMIVMRLRGIQVEALNVPIRYRDRSHISLNEAKKIASDANLGEGLRAVYADRKGQSPLYWWFNISGGDGARAGGGFAIDRVDGHIWTYDEIEEYSHDYNNSFWVA